MPFRLGIDERGMFWVISSCPSDHALEHIAETGGTTAHLESVKLGRACTSPVPLL